MSKRILSTKKRGLIYSIPLLRIQNTLLTFYENYEYNNILNLIYGYVGRHTNSDVRYEVTFDLEKQWYPVIHTNDRWLADLIIRRYIELRPSD